MNRSSRRTVPVAVVLALALTASACSGGGKHAGPTTTGTGGSTGSGGTGGTTTTTTPLADGKVRTGANGKLALLLSKGQPLAALAATPVKLVTGTDLGPDAVAPIVARLSPWVDDATLPAGFRWPSQTLPAPRAGTTVAQAFPSPAAIGGPPAPVVTAGDLEVRRVQPSDDVAIAPFVTVSFNQPMVPVSTVDQVEALTVPATITPAIAGHWRWLGTQTLRFDADRAAVGADRLPMATEYTVTIPAGTTSALGGKLASAKSFTFRTPPVTVLSTQPVEQVALPLDPVMVLAFDQRVDPAEVVKHLKLTADGDDQPVRIATAAEIAARTQGDAKVAPGTATISTDNLVEGRWIAVTPGKPLPPDAAIELTVGKGTPSAEGPRTTDGSKTYRWHTYAPLRVTKVNCGDPSPCPPTGSITVEFVNELDAAKFDPATVVVRPELAQRSVSMYGNVVQIGGVTKPRTTYEVTLPAGITDVYGQTLGKDETRKVEFGASRPILEQFPSVFTTLDPLAGSPSLTIGTVNHDKVHLQLFAVTPTDWAAFQRYLIELQQQPDGALPAAPWRPLVDRVVDVDNKDDTRVETRVDLGEALGGDGLGHLVALVAPTETYDQSDQDYWPNRPTLSWVQATKIGFDAFADNDEIRAWITDLGTGAPRADVAVSMLGPSGSTVGARAVSDGEGVARLTPPPVDETNGAPGAIALLATSGDDVALLSQSAYFGSGWSSTSVSDEARWYVVDDRHTYRPGETVSVKGFVRRFEASGDGQLHLLRSGTVRYEAFDAQGVAIGNGQATLNPLGGFDFTLVVPLGANQGPTNVSLTGEGFAGVRFTGSGYSFAVQEFRRPEYEVVTRTEGDAPAAPSARRR